MKLSLLSLLMICGLAFNIKAEKTPVDGKRQPLSGQVESIPGDLTGPRYRQSLVALATLDASSGQVITAYNSDLPLVPASVLKLVTTATALELLGPEHRFETGLDYVGTLKNGVLEGDLVIRGGGDPTLGSKHLGENCDAYLSTLISQVKAAGIKAVKGRVVGDAGLFDEEPLSPYWLWEDIGNYYAAGICGLGVRDNSYTLNLRSGAPGSNPDVLGTEPPLPRLQIDNHLVAAPNNKDSAYLYGQPYDWHRSLHGTMPANKAFFSIKGDLPDPPLYAASALRDALVKNGITVDKAPATLRTYSLPKAKCVRLGVVKSPPLKQIITIIHHHSDNIYAEYLLRQLAGVQYAPPYTARQGLSVIYDYWQRKGLDTDGLLMVDGSGLSPVNRLSARFLGDLLAFMSSRSNYGEVFEATLPKAGMEGTVASFLKGTSLAGKFRLKSGSNQYTTAYAGYGSLNGTKQVVVMLVNHTNLSPWQIRKDMADFLLGR